MPPPLQRSEDNPQCLTTIFEQNHESCTPNIRKQGGGLQLSQLDESHNNIVNQPSAFNQHTATQLSFDQGMIIAADGKQQSSHEAAPKNFFCNDDKSGFSMVEEIQIQQ